MESISVLRRSKRHTPKVRSGCVTCKRRRVKCDEQKPTCQRCETNRIHCEGYAPPKSWIFEPQQRPATTVLSPQLHQEDGSIGEGSSVAKLYPSKDLHYQGTFAGRRDELMAYEFFAKMTAPVAGRWAAPELWQGLLLRAAWVDAAIKDCIVSLAITSIETKHSDAQTSTLKTLRPRDYYYFRAASLLSRQHKKPMELCLIASVTFWHFDLFNRRPLRAMIHLHAATTLLRSMRRSPPFSTALTAEIDQLLCSLAGIEYFHETSNTNHILPLSEGCSVSTQRAKAHGFPSLNAARASLSRCIWAAVLAYDPSPTAHMLRDLADLEHIAFEKEIDKLLDFSDLPFCTLNDCLDLLKSWQRWMWLTPDTVIPFIGRQSLLLHAQLLQSIVEKDVNNVEHEVPDIEVNDECLFVRVLDSVADIVGKTKHCKQSYRGTKCTQLTSLRPVVLFILRRTNLEDTFARATQVMQDVEIMEEGTDTVLLTWMGFVSENTKTSGPPVG